MVPKLQNFTSPEPIIEWTWLNPHLNKKGMILSIVYIIHSQKSNRKTWNVIKDAIGKTKSTQSSFPKKDHT